MEGIISEQLTFPIRPEEFVRRNTPYSQTTHQMTQPPSYEEIFGNN